MRPSNTRQRRQQIARALISVMARKGYDGAAITDVAAEAGLTPGLVHYHFRNKLEILLEALDALADRHQRGLDRRVVEAGYDPWRRLEAFIDFHLALGEADPEVLACWIMLSGEALRQPEVRERYQATLLEASDRLRVILRDGREAGLFAPVDLEAVPAALIAAIQGYYVLAATAGSLVPRGSAAGCVRRMAEGLLGRAPLERAMKGGPGPAENEPLNEEETPCAG